MKAFSIERLAKIFTYAEPISMANSFKGLSKIIQAKLGKERENGDMFLFMNKKRTYLKILFYSKDGFCIFAKKLDHGFFEEPAKGQLSIGELCKLVDHVILNFGLKQKGIDEK